MNKKNAIRLAAVTGAALAAFAAVAVAGAAPRAAATTKSLSTVYAVQNFGVTTATVSVDYKLDTGVAWGGVSAGNTSFKLGPGSAANIAQYLDATMASGRGSATISADQPVGAVVNLLARNQDATSGSYSAFSAGAATVYAPLVFKGLAGINSTLTVMNVSGAATDVDIVYIDGVTFSPVATKTITALAAGVSAYVDQSDETALPAGYYGSAVVMAKAAGGAVAVVGNQFVGAHSLLTYPGFASTEGFTSWGVPIYFCRLANGFSSPITIQNVSGSTIAAGGIAVDMTSSAGNPALKITNTTAIPNNASFVVNLRTNQTCPTGDFGSAKVTATGNVVTLINQLQQGFGASLSYNAVRTDSTNKKALSPTIFSRLGNGFSTAVTIQNLSGSATANISIVYTPNPACAGCAAFTFTGTAGPNGSLIQNHRVGESATSHPLTAGWFGSMVASADQPIVAVVNQLKLDDPNIAVDQSLSFNGFSQP